MINSKDNIDNIETTTNTVNYSYGKIASIVKVWLKSALSAISTSFFLYTRSKNVPIHEVSCISMTTAEDMSDFLLISEKYLFAYWTDWFVLVFQEYTCSKGLLNMYGVIFHFHKLLKFKFM